MELQIVHLSSVLNVFCVKTCSIVRQMRKRPFHPTPTQHSSVKNTLSHSALQFRCCVATFSRSRMYRCVSISLRAAIRLYNPCSFNLRITVLPDTCKFSSSLIRRAEKKGSWAATATMFKSSSGVVTGRRVPLGKSNSLPHCSNVHANAVLLE